MPMSLPDRRARKWIYIAGPYTKPDPIINVRTALRIGEDLFRAGFFPIVPHLTMLAHLVSPHEPDYWYDFDYHLMERCDALLRFPGESTGADRECDLATKWSIPVVEMISSIMLQLSDTDKL